jgi:DNA-directed RNA polymerase subunit RPC12/RpoP
MEIERSIEHGLNNLDTRDSLIKVRAIISCPSCSYKKKFKNQFQRDQLELMVVTLKVFDWMVCSKCGDLLKLDLEFEI